MATEGQSVSDSRDEVFGCYLAFRHADRAAQRGRIPASSLAAVAGSVRQQVSAIWKAMFPGREAEAYAWILERTRLLENEGVVSMAAGDRLAQVARERAAGAKSPVGRGALATLWRIHLLYLLVVEQAEAGQLLAATVVRVKEAVHMMALTALQEAVRIAGPKGTELLDAVLARARAVVQGLVDTQALPATDGAFLLAGLGRGEGATGPRAVVDATAGTCQVCGEVPGQFVVYCAACDSPHHADCWRYAGKCSIFACGCTEATPRPGAGMATDPPPRFDLEHPRPPPLTKAPPPPEELSPLQVYGGAIVCVVFFLMLAFG